MLLYVLPSSPAVVLPQSVGGEWAGWRVSYSPAGKLQRVHERFLDATAIEYGQIPAGFEELTSEQFNDDGASLSRRVVQIPPQDGCACEDLVATVEHHELPLASLLQAPGVWSLAEEFEADGSIWRVRCAFDGLGGPRPRSMRGALPATATRTRVELCFDAAAGCLVAEQPLTVWQERQWDEDLSLEVRSASGGRSGLDAAWVSAAIGMSCWAEAKSAVGIVAAEESKLSLPGGITIVSSPGCLEVSHQRTDQDGAASGAASSGQREFSLQAEAALRGT